MRIIKRHLGDQDYEDTKANTAIAAALVHDLGHGPFSHAFEDVGRRLNLKLTRHEVMSDILIREGEVADALNILVSGLANDVAAMVKNGGTDIYSAVVSSQFDADRLDYMRRDQLMTGTQHGSIDYEWLLANLEVGGVPFGVDEENLGTIETFVLGPKAVHGAEAYVLGLFQLYPTVYFHKATRGAEKLFTELMVRTLTLIKEGSLKSTGLHTKHPIVRFAKKPDSADSVLSLDDTVIWGSLGYMIDASDPTVKDLAIRLRDRKLYKAIDVREFVKRELGLEEVASLDPVIDKACASIRNKIAEWQSTHATTNPARILSDSAEREPYKQFQESKGPLNQIRIRTNSDELVDLGERSKVVRAIETFKLFRLYVSETDDKARAFIEKTIREESKNAAKD